MLSNWKFIIEICLGSRSLFSGLTLANFDFECRGVDDNTSHCFMAFNSSAVAVLRHRDQQVEPKSLRSANMVSSFTQKRMSFYRDLQIPLVSTLVGGLFRISIFSIGPKLF